MPGNEPDTPSGEESPPSDTFGLVGHEIRAEIIQVLEPGDELSLSGLRSRLDANVEPSQLHYHLQQLVGHFLEKTVDGYRLNSVGRRLSLTIRAGSFDRRNEHLVIDANVDCYHCQAPVTVIFDDGCVSIVCSDCQQRYMEDYYYVPLDLFEDKAAVFSHFTHYQTLKFIFISSGICFNCATPISPSFHDLDEWGSLDEFENFNVILDLACGRCGATWWQSLGMALRADSGLRSFCLNHDVDLLSTPHWELEFAMTDKHVTVRSTDPWEVALDVTFDGDTLELVVDGDLNVLERNRLEATREGHLSLLRRIQSGAYTTGSGGRRDIVILPDNADCLEYLRHHRWSDGVTCPRCESEDTVKKGTTGKDAKRYRCQDCGDTFNDLTGTIFADHRFTLAEMFYIIRQMDETTTAEIARQLDRSSESVSDFVCEVRDAQEAVTVFDR